MVDQLQEQIVQFSFDGGGWMHSFLFGVAEYIEEHFDTTSPLLRFSGSSSGAAVVAPLAAGVPMNDYFTEALTCYESCRTNPFNNCNEVERIMRKVSPPDGVWEKLASGRVCVNLTRIRVYVRWVWVLKCKLWFIPITIPVPIPIPILEIKPHHVTEFKDRETAISVVRGSCHLPVFGGIRGYDVPGIGRVWDGNMSTHFTRFPDVHGKIKTIRVSVWYRSESDMIGSGVPFTRWNWSYFPQSPDMLRALKRLGYYRAAEYFAKNNNNFRHVMKTKNPHIHSDDDIRDNLEDLLALFKSMVRPVAKDRVGESYGYDVNERVRFF